MPGLDALGFGQATGVAQGQALKIIGGIPILKNASGSTLERLKLPKHLDVGNVGSLLKKVMSGGIGSVLQNPLAAAQGQMSGAITGAISKITAVVGSGGAGLTSTLGTLNTSVGSLSALAGNLSGSTSQAGLPNNFDLYGHIGLAQSFGDDVPAGLGIEVATAPLAMSPVLATMADRIGIIAASVAAGTMLVAAATAEIAAMIATVDATTTNASNAIATLSAAGPALMAAQAAVASLVPGTLPPGAAAAMRACIRPDTLAAVDAILAAHDAAIGAGPPA